MSHLSYLAVLGFVLAGTLWLEFALRTNVLRRLRRLALAVLPVWVLFTVWDWYAVGRGHWTFDPARVVGIEIPEPVPVEELLFFLIVPLAAILTLEAVRSVRGWHVGDEEQGDANRAQP